MKQIVIGMAGRIDHGKTSVIKSLTGTQTERYSEELERGLTIDIGFAFLNENIALIDVPGHEKFIKNMLAGSYGIDFTILVIAADDGIKPQTMEHFEILKLLNIKFGLIVLNKIDLADEDWVDLLIEDIRKMTKKSFLENCKIIKTSTTKDIGIKKLNDEIIDSSKNIPNKYDRGFFRMAVDRAFTIKGYGTVVTGTVTSGKISIGNSIDVMPNGEQYKVRGIHSQGKSVNTVGLGYRAAVNIGNLNIEHISRGHQISSPGYLTTLKKMIVYCTLLENSKKPLRQNQRIRVHIGTNESIGRISLVNSNKLNPGENCMLLIKLESEIIATMGDKFILRTFSPLMTIGGGIVIDKIVNQKWKVIKTYIASIEGLDKNQIKKYMIESQKFNPLSYEESKVKFGLGNNQIDEFINLNNEICCVKHKTSKWLISDNQLKQCKDELLEILKSNVDAYDIGFSKSLILQKTNGNVKFLDFLLEDLEILNEIHKKNEKWIIKGAKIVLNNSDELLKVNLLNMLDKEGFVTSNLEELSIANNCEKEKIKKILNILEKDNQVIRLNETLIFSMKNLNNLKSSLNKFYLSNEILSMKDFKEMADTTRKYAVPLLEYFDKIKFTFRVDEGRKLI